LQRLQERQDIADLPIVEHAVRTPRRHYGFRIVDTRVIDVVEQPFVSAPAAADLGQIRSNIPRQVGAASRTHDMTSEAGPAPRAIGHELLPIGGITGDGTRWLALLWRGWRSVAVGEGIEIGEVGFRPGRVRIPPPRTRRRIALGRDWRQ